MNTKQFELENYRIDAIVAGVEKAGTTSLGYYLAQHPNIHSHFFQSLPPEKQVNEFSFFIQHEWHQTDIFKREYEYAFKRQPDYNELMVAKHIGIMYREGAAENLKKCFPNCKIIASLRNPIDRAYSSFWHQRYRGEETTENFEEAIEREMAADSFQVLSPHLQYLKRGQYVDQLTHLTELFGQQNLHVVLLEDLKNMPHETLGGIFRFLGLPAHEIQIMGRKNLSKAVRWPALAQFINQENPVKKLIRFLLPMEKRKQLLSKLRTVNSVEQQAPEMSGRTRARLVEYFKPYNQRLEKFLEKDLSHWNK